MCVQATSETWPKLRDAPRLGVSVLAEGHDEACLSLSRKHGDRFAEVNWEQTPNGAIVVHGSSAWLECTVYAEVPAGDHGIVLLEIHAMRGSPDVAPLVFHGSRFRKLMAEGVG